MRVARRTRNDTIDRPQNSRMGISGATDRSAGRSCRGFAEAVVRRRSFRRRAGSERRVWSGRSAQVGRGDLWAGDCPDGLNGRHLPFGRCPSESRRTFPVVGGSFSELGWGVGALRRPLESWVIAGGASSSRVVSSSGGDAFGCRLDARWLWGTKDMAGDGLQSGTWVGKRGGELNLDPPPLAARMRADRRRHVGSGSTRPAGVPPHPPHLR